MKCSICERTDGIKLYGVTVDGEQLRLQVPLCGDHGDRYLLLIGNLIGLLIYGQGRGP